MLMKNPIQKIALLLSFCLVMVPGMLLSLHMDQLGETTPFLNFALIFVMLLFGMMTIETLRKISSNENIDFNQQKIEIIHSSFILMENPNVEESYDDIEFQYPFQPSLVDTDIDQNHLSN